MKRVSDRKQVSKPCFGDSLGQLAKMLRDLKPEHGLAQVWSVLPASTLAAGLQIALFDEYLCSTRERKREGPAGVIGYYPRGNPR